MYEICLTTFWDESSKGWGSRRIFERFLTSTLANLGLITTPRGGYVLENFSIKRRLAQKRLSSLSIFKKMLQDFLKKQNHRGSARQIFFTLVVEKPLKKVATYMTLLRQKQPISGKVVKANHVCDLYDVFFRWIEKW